MKKFIIFLTFTFLIVHHSNAQDSLIMRSGVNILAKVVEVGTSEVKYKTFDNLNGPLYSIFKTDLLMIRYENGTKDVFSDLKKDGIVLVSNQDLYSQGKADALNNYHNYKNAGTGVLLTTSIPLWGPILGLVPLGLCISTLPSDENLGYSDSELMKNSEYANGYRDKAKQIKKNKVLKNYYTGFKVNLGYLAVAAVVGFVYLVTYY